MYTHIDGRTCTHTGSDNKKTRLALPTFISCTVIAAHNNNCTEVDLLSSRVRNEKFELPSPISTVRAKTTTQYFTKGSSPVTLADRLVEVKFSTELSLLSVSVSEYVRMSPRGKSGGDHWTTA